MQENIVQQEEACKMYCKIYHVISDEFLEMENFQWNYSQNNYAACQETVDTFQNFPKCHG